MLKRKRSASELSPSPSSSGSPPTRDRAKFAMDDVPRALYEAPAAHLHSRTFKRFRDCRPPDDEVHQRTLSLLYSAQRHQHASPATPFAAPAAATAPLPSSAGNQQSLHRFWNITSAPGSAGSSPGVDQPVVAVPSSCEDCGASLTGADGGGGNAMELDGFGFDVAACGACGKHVCFSCSVSNLGDEKRCLQCAGRRVWIGGIGGWTNAPVSAR